MPLRETKGAASAQGFGAGINTGSQTIYTNDVFNTYLYTGNLTARSIENGIDLAGKGGMVWIKSRTDTDDHYLFDTNRGILNAIVSDTTSSQVTIANSLTSFNSNGFNLANSYRVNSNAPQNYVAWTFRKQTNFFDVVTYTGNGVNNRAIPHNLGTAPGMILLKNTSTTGPNWVVYHRSLGATQYVYLNRTDAAGTYPFWADTEPTATNFYVSNAQPETNTNGSTYVAYLFAHDATANGVIQCGSFTAVGSAASITLGWEPQYVMMKNTSSTGDWYIFDTMRGWTTLGAVGDNYLFANSSAVETTYTGSLGGPNATGFNFENISSTGTYVYIAIRRPNKPPTTGTQVFSPVLVPSGSLNVNSGFVVDAVVSRRYNYSQDNLFSDRLRNGGQDNLRALFTNLTSAETAQGVGTSLGYDNNTGLTNNWQGSSYDNINYALQRAPGFFDVVCYKGDGNLTYAVPHNLGVAPEFAIIKCRSNGSTNWIAAYRGTSSITTFRLNATDAGLSGLSLSYLSSSTFTVGGSALGWNETTVTSNFSGGTYVAYLFATLPSISKVGSYTGTGATQTINCGFSSGARFVLIKRTDSTGGWYVFDTSRGMTSYPDPYFFLDSTAIQATSSGSAVSVTTGFSVSGTDTNTNGATYIFLAIA